MDCAELTNFGDQLAEFANRQVTPVDDGLADQAGHGNEIRRLISIGIGSKASDLGFNDPAASVQLSVDDKHMPGEGRFAAGMEIDKVARIFALIFTGQMY